jgi:putative molybdopterin biosynthesis protein
VNSVRRHDDRLRLSRVARGLSQESLASLAGVTRQAISGIESGRFSPSLDVALALAGALGSSVEDLFGPAPALESTQVQLAGSGAGEFGTGPAGAPAPRLLLADVGDVTIGFGLTGDRSLVPGFRPAMAETDAAGDGGPQVTARRLAAPARAVAVAGCDPALALLEGPLRRHAPPLSLVWHPCGNAAARKLVEDGAVHAAALHRHLGEDVEAVPGCTVVGFAGWREGLVVSPAWADRVASIADAVELRLRLVNREAGSEARRLLDEALDRCGADPSALPGYETACSAHLLVASSIVAGLADVGVASEPAALAYGLAFVAWQEEICELHVPRGLLGTVEVQGLVDVLAGAELEAQLAAIPGYDAGPLGEVAGDG